MSEQKYEIIAWIFVTFCMGVPFFYFISAIFFYFFNIDYLMIFIDFLGLENWNEFFKLNFRLFLLFIHGFVLFLIVPGTRKDIIESIKFRMKK